jgi:hypothetical protein
LAADNGSLKGTSHERKREGEVRTDVTKVQFIDLDELKILWRMLQRLQAERFPDAHDGWDRLGMVYQARGDNQKAADCYRKVIEVIRAHPENYDPDFEAIFHRLVEKLDPSVTT